MEYGDDVAEGESATAAFAALADPTRRGVLDALRGGEGSARSWPSSGWPSPGCLSTCAP